MSLQDPSELKKLSLPQLQLLADDLRQTIISTCLKNGGHLGASLGAVELAIALHRVFESPREPLIWDVGHQAYAHKLLTGRAARFSTLRKTDGISGFLSREESPHDIFGAGHSSTSLSAALAIAWAKKGTLDWTVAVIGDGGLTAGIAFEALNNIRARAVGPLLIVLNDNQMSIAPNVGAMPTILSGDNPKEFFSLFGCQYLGPIDGHNLEQLIGSFQGIRESGSLTPVVLHALTQKGKGYAPAEEDPGSYHGISPLRVTKVDEKTNSPQTPGFSAVFGEALCKIAAENKKVIAVTAAMPEGTGLTDFSHRFPERFFDVGIAEQHAVTFSAGLATQGYRPVAAIYSTFLQRALDSVIHDVAIQKLPVIFAIDRAGIVGADGPTHHGEFDLVYLGMIPGMTVLTPETLSDMENSLRFALTLNGPVAIRYPRGTALPAPQGICRSNPGLRWYREVQTPKLIIYSVGTATARVKKALSLIDLERAGEAEISWASVLQVKPIPAEIQEMKAKFTQVPILVVEDGVVHGGFGQQLGAEVIGYGDHFIPHGSLEALEEKEGVSAVAVAERIRRILSSLP